MTDQERGFARSCTCADEKIVSSHQPGCPKLDVIRAPIVPREVRGLTRLSQPLEKR